ncbi:MAG: HYR domain-containing protein [Acidobacteria bacterium]|nr:HYR domain-containing protein [Acidobacteriota bacterium]
MRFHSSSTLVPVVTVLLWLSACAESSVLPPATPSPLPADRIGRLAIACPAGGRAQSFDGRPATVHFAAPVVSGGQPPVTAGCSPHSGSAFGIGTTEVTCGASDALQQTASCVFGVTVLGPPKLAVTRLLAFGDSITAGVVSSPNGGARLDSFNSYPARLRRRLASLYLTQDIEVVNAGVPGEEASQAEARFGLELGRHRPEVVLLMHGTNDLDVIAGSGADSAAAALDGMVAAARAAGIDTLLMTIPPQRGTGSASLVSGLNSSIQAIAARHGAELIDIHHLLLTGPCSGLPQIPCIGRDGLHPTEQGYDLMAQELERVLVARYDVEIVPATGEQRGAARGMALASGEQSVARRRQG